MTSRALPELSGWSEKSQSSAVLELAEVAKKGLFECPHSKRKAKEGVDLLLFGVEDPGTKDMDIQCFYDAGTDGVSHLY